MTANDTQAKPQSQNEQKPSKFKILKVQLQVMFDKALQKPTSINVNKDHQVLVSNKVTWKFRRIILYKLYRLPVHNQ